MPPEADLLLSSAPNEDQVQRARILAEDLLAVLRIEYQKARDGGSTMGGGAPGIYQQGYGTYAPADQGPYAGYYVSHLISSEWVD